MGIKYLPKFIKNKFPEVISIKNISELSGKKIGFDSPCLIYKYKSSITGKDELIWLNYVLRLILFMIENCIEPIFVIEGKSQENKLKEQIKRKEKKEKINERTILLENALNACKSNIYSNEEINILENFWKINKKNPDQICGFIKDEKKICKIEKLLNARKKKYNISISQKDTNVFIDLLKLLNVTIVYSTYEAETTCSLLYKNNKIDYIFSGDSDVLAYIGTNGFINDISISTKTFSFFCKNTLLKCVKLNEYQFIDWCILCGTDYNKTKKGIGIVTSLELIRNVKHSDNKNFSLDFSKKFSEEECKEYNLFWIRNKFTFQEDISDNLNESEYKHASTLNLKLSEKIFFTLWKSTEKYLKDVQKKEQIISYMNNKLKIN